MGNQGSFEQHLDFKDIKTNYTSEKKFNDTRFGEIKLLKEKSTGQTLFQKDFTSSTAKDFEDYVKEINDCAVLAHPNVVKVHGYNTSKEDLFCADFYKLSLFFESFETDLEQEINQRKTSKEHFPETELWYILDSTASAAAYLQHNNIPHKDIRPYNILITPAKEYKLSATKLFRQSYDPGQLGHFEGADAQSRYYSPELLTYHATAEGKRTPYDQHKNDVFGLGMTMLEAGLLEKTPEAYDFENLSVRQQPIRESLNKLRERYSENFVKTIESTLDFNPETRLDFARLDSELSVYRREIRERARGASAAEEVREVSSGIVQNRTPRAQQERAHKAGAPDAGVRENNAAPLSSNRDDDLDRRVREAVKKSEETIRRSSPTKYANKDLDPYIESFLRNDIKTQAQPLLYTISPFLTSESKYTTTLTIEQPNYGRESQPLNFGASQPRDDVGESVKRSAFVDAGAGVDTGAQGQVGGYSQSYGQTAPFSYQSPTAYGQTDSAYAQAGVSQGQTGAYQDLNNYRQPTESYGQQYSQSGPSFGQQNYTQQNNDYNQYGLTSGNSGQAGSNIGYGTSQNYGLTQNYGLGQNYGVSQNYGAGQAYGTTSGTYGANNYDASPLDGSQKNYAAEADELTKRIEERLRQSRTMNQQAY